MFQSIVTYKEDSWQVNQQKIQDKIKDIEENPWFCGKKTIVGIINKEEYAVINWKLE